MYRAGDVISRLNSFASNAERLLVRYILVWSAKVRAYLSLWLVEISAAGSDGNLVNDAQCPNKGEYWSWGAQKIRGGAG